MSQETQQTEGQEATPVEVRRKKLPLRLLKVLGVSVGQEEIDNAHIANSRKCMIHRSIEREYPTLKNIVVDKHQVRCTDPDRNVIYTFPMAPLARVAIEKWDSGEPVPPFSFKLRHPIIRDRVKRGGVMRPKSSQDAAVKSLGAVRRPKTAESRAMAGRDRVFGAKLWTAELAKVRELLAVPTAA
jgi:hypothetical protein